MAELLIRLKNNTHVDPVKDRMCYKRGDIVVVMPNGHVWGKEEGLPDFAVVVVDRSVKFMKRFISEHKVERMENHKIPRAAWEEDKARGDYGYFTRRPDEGLIETLDIPLKPLLGQKLRTGRETFINLSGPVLRPHTRRKWRLNEVVVRKAESTGFVIIPFAELRIELQDKITGANA